MIFNIRSASLLAAVALMAGSSQGFVHRGPVRLAPSKTATKSQLADVGDTGTGWDSFETMKKEGIVPSGEEARKYRRTVYTHDDWKKHRSQDRFITYLTAVFSSGVYKTMYREVAIVTASAFFVCFWNNGIVGDYQDLAGINHAGLLSGSGLPILGLPLESFTLASSSLGLLLTFRANQSYKRWDEARKNWGMNINHTRDLCRMANAYYDTNGVSPEQRQADLDRVAACTWAFVRSMKRHLSPEEEDEEKFRIELYEKLPKEQAEMIIAAAHRPNRALQDLSYSIDNLPMHFMRKNEIHAACTIFEDNLGSSERLLTSPIPLFYSRHTVRFLGVWLCLLPFALYKPFGATWNHVGMIPAAAVLAVFLFGIEELATQLEEPFTILPMQAFCDKIYNWCREIVSWAPGDNGRQMKPVQPQHAYFAQVNAPKQQPMVFAAAAPEPATNSVNGNVAQAPPPPPAAPSTNAMSDPGMLSMADFLKQQGQGR